MSETIGTEEGELCNRGGCTGLIEIKWETNGTRFVCTECGASKAETAWREGQEATQHDPVNHPKHYKSLVEAATQLLEACEEAAKYFEQEVGLSGGESEVMDQLLNAIKKAKG